MNEGGHSTEAAGTTAARSIVFAITVALVVMSALAIESAEAWLVALALVLLGLAADALVVWLGGARGSMIARAVSPTVLVWLVTLGFGVALGTVQLWLPPDQPVAVLGQMLLLLICSVGAIAWLLPQVQAIWMWILASLGIAAICLPTALELPETEQIAAYTAVALAAGSLGTLAFYVRSTASRRLGWTRIVARLSLAALAVLFSVAVSLEATMYVGRLGYHDQSQSAFEHRRTYSIGVARLLSETFDESEFATATPGLSRELVRFAALGDVGLTVYDRAARRIVAAVRLAPPADGARPGGTLATEPDDPGLMAFKVVTVGTAETAEMVAAVDSPGVPEAVPAIGPMPHVLQPLGFADRQNRPDAGPDSTLSPMYLASGDDNPDGGRFILIVSDSLNSWMGPSISPEQISRSLSVTLTPWMFLAFIFPSALGLLALDRRDAARESLAAADERSRLNRDAHDRVYNRLTALANRLAASEPSDAHAPTPADDIRRTVDDLQAILGDSTIAQGTSGSCAASLLMADACAEQGRIWDTDVALKGAELLEGVDPRVGWELQCIAEEALTNAAKHGRATHARVSLSRPGEWLVLEIVDDGSGVVTPLGDDGLPKDASGLRGMADRARALGGELAISTGAEGTSITVRIPLRTH